MTVTIDLSDDELDQLKKATNASDAKAAVTAAAKEFLRIRQLKQLKSASGQVDFQLDWQGLELLELGELPQ